MNLPKHINLSIEHNPHKICYQSAAQYFADLEIILMHEDIDIAPEDRKACEAADEIWEIHWYPRTPVGFHRVFAPTLEKALELANSIDADVNTEAKP